MTTNSEEVSRQRHARPQKSHVRLRLRKKILGDDDDSDDGSVDDVDDVPPPLQVTPGMSDHHVYICFIVKSTHIFKRSSSCYLFLVDVLSSQKKQYL